MSSEVENRGVEISLTMRTAWHLPSSLDLGVAPLVLACR